MRSSLLSVHPEEESRDRTLVLCLIMRRATTQRSTAAAALHIPIQPREFRLLHFPTLVEVVIHIFLMKSDVEHLSMCLLATYISSLEKCMYKSSTRSAVEAQRKGSELSMFV